MIAIALNWELQDQELDRKVEESGISNTYKKIST
jgi:hypothetical protein